MSWDGIDFEKVMFAELACPDFAQARGRAEVFSVRYADLTGDDRREAVVAGACFTTTAANPAQVIVFAGRDTGEPRPLVAIGKGQDLVTTKVRISGRTITVTSKGLSKEAARCCPDRLITQAYRWTGDRFERISRTDKPL